MIIGISGYARSGKDTIADHLVNSYGFSQKSFASDMKKAMYILNPIVKSDNIGIFRYRQIVDVYGLDVAKDTVPEIRRLLQVFGTEVGRDMFGVNFWVNLVLNNIDVSNVVVSDVRFKNEADAIREAGGQIWRVNRKNVKPITGHVSEIDLDDYKFDQVINNDLSVEDLYSLVDNIILNV
jgi:hypothetical protein